MRTVSAVLFLGLLSLATLQPVSAEVYKWVDENGKVQYSAQKPAGKDVQKIAVPSPTVTPLPTPTVAAGTPAPLPTPTAVPTMTPEAKAEHCKDATNRYTGMEASPRVFKVAPDGERVRLTEEERQDAMATAKKEMSKFCE